MHNPAQPTPPLSSLYPDLQMEHLEILGSRQVAVWRRSVERHGQEAQEEGETGRTLGTSYWECMSKQIRVWATEYPWLVVASQGPRLPLIRVDGVTMKTGRCRPDRLKPSLSRVDADEKLELQTTMNFHSADTDPELYRLRLLLDAYGPRDQDPKVVLVQSPLGDGTVRYLWPVKLRPEIVLANTGVVAAPAVSIGKAVVQRKLKKKKGSGADGAGA